MLLGLNRHATKAEIRDAWKRRVKGCHPDVGGSENLTKEVNAAKETLLGERGAVAEFKSSYQGRWRPPPQRPSPPPPPPEPEIGLWDTPTREEEIARQERAESEGRVRWPVRG